jgi:D-sedoheptulose 7-phosphate isomerase
MDYINQYFTEAALIIDQIDRQQVKRLVDLLGQLQQRSGRLFLLGIGGSAANCSHAVNDFRKICHIEAYTPVDNVSELTARINDDGWESVFAEWLRTSCLNKKDMILVFSVGGGDLEKNVSPNLVRAIQYAREVGASIAGIVGRATGYTATVADACVVIPIVNHEALTPHAEAFQGVIWHLLVSHPDLKKHITKWESLR